MLVCAIGEGSPVLLYRCGTMVDFAAIVERELVSCKERIQADMAALHINASGRSSRAFNVRVGTDSLQLVYGSGERIAPLDTLEIGRAAGNVPGGFVMTKAGVRDVSKVFKSILIEWAKNKGFELGWGGATMLGRRIAEVGTLRHLQPEDVWSTHIKQTAEKIKHEIPIAVRTEVKQAVTNF